ncbi:uncharacterized protein [Sinocyclocheilus grahami]|uniref:uncharacterized protein isoform X1 n=1 Tax=Sinocyclocheilus grahami TaxID=75366 RepID=UPI0007ACD8AE|nr:PREDICTED: uncharacterized protein LOC107567805 isoform X1 [Sinocyclocheilus grahami]XP_016109059.1 PREDICTED: uncharacterized protein LOC107567805 isoform X2 [Sinocyclocheilus grahami]
MNAVNAVQLFILVWTFTAVCQADKDLSVSCDDVIGSVGKEVHLTCSVSLQCPNCSIQMCKFRYPESFKDSTICKEEPPVNSCDQRNSFTCRYTPNTTMTEKFSFFVQTNCGRKTTKFTVDIAGPTTPETVSGAPGEQAEVKIMNASGRSAPDTAAGHKSKVSVIAAAVGCFILIIIIMTIIHYKKSIFTKPCEFQDVSVHQI